MSNEAEKAAAKAERERILRIAEQIQIQQPPDSAMQVLIRWLKEAPIE